ncbi:MAG: ABC transporter permease [bacterium]|nr:ABC transporter permease [bacterium]
MNNIYQQSKIKPIIFKTLKFLLLTFVLFITYAPLIIIALMSVNKDATAIRFSGFTFKWYSGLFNNKDLLKTIFVNTVLVAIISTICATVFGTITAIGINSLSKKRRKQMIMLNNVPILNADIATAVLLFIVFQVIGFILHIDAANRLNYFTLVLSHIFFSTPYVILSVLPKLGEIDKNLYDAALDLGCKPKRAILKVIIPAIKTGIFTGAMLAFTMSIDDFVISYFVSGPDNANFSTWFYARRKMSKTNSSQYAAAYNTLLTLITITALIVYNIIKKKKEKRAK